MKRPKGEIQKGPAGPIFEAEDGTVYDIKNCKSQSMKRAEEGSYTDFGIFQNRSRVFISPPEIELHAVFTPTRFYLKGFDKSYDFDAEAVDETPEITDGPKQLPEKTYGPGWPD